MALISGYLALGSAVSTNGVLTELSGSGYGRQATTVNYDPAGNLLTFTGATFGPVTGSLSASVVAIYDGSGNLVFSFPVPSTAIASGGSFTVGNGQITLTTPLTAGNSLASRTQLGTALTTINNATVNEPATSGAVAFSYSGTSLSASPPIISVSSASGTYTLDFSAGASYRLTLTGNLTLANPVNAVPGNTYRVFLVQDGTGSRTLTLGSAFKTAGGAPTLSTTAGAQDRITLFYDGTNFFGELFKAFA